MDYPFGSLSSLLGLFYNSLFSEDVFNLVCYLFKQLCQSFLL